MHRDEICCLDNTALHRHFFVLFLLHDFMIVTLPARGLDCCAINFALSSKQAGKIATDGVPSAAHACPTTT
jgi:hypothetical protein